MVYVTLAAGKTKSHRLVLMSSDAGSTRVRPQEGKADLGETRKVQDCRVQGQTSACRENTLARHEVMWRHETKNALRESRGQKHEERTTETMDR